jgi:hypothetical protein
VTDTFAIRVCQKFDGETFDQDRDGPRLNRQCQTVFDLMQDRQWRTLREISRACNEPEASVSARLRDLRKTRFGSYDVQRQHVAAGVWEYRVMPPVPSDQLELMDADQ